VARNLHLAPRCGDGPQARSARGGGGGGGFEELALGAIAVVGTVSLNEDVVGSLPTRPGCRRGDGEELNELERREHTYREGGHRLNRVAWLFFFFSGRWDCNWSNHAGEAAVAVYDSHGVARIVIAVPVARLTPAGHSRRRRGNGLPARSGIRFPMSAILPRVRTDLPTKRSVMYWNRSHNSAT